ncbi:hypothetical protein WA026_015699 [Henosepilachna vigintioctopunctata]|uniref:ATP synthase F0 subunit 6 n=1 Tax=Henosepilachna vigintioctopunctata TaxID=420089 RepID=A0AAW1V283_9CUCU
MLSTLHMFLTFSLLSLLRSVFPVILRSTFISVVSSSRLVFVVSGLVSAVYVIMGLTVAL